MRRLIKPLATVFLKSKNAILTIIKENISLAVLAILGVGAGPAIVMGFSPTIYISGERTFIFFYFSLLLVSLMIVEKMELTAENGILHGRIVKTWGVFTVFAVANSVFYIFSRY